MSNQIPRSLIYFGNCLNCDEGYEELDLRVVPMRFKLSQTRPVDDMQTRPVRVGDRCFRIWSPNSTRAPYYPGPIRGDFFPATPVSRASRRYDGHVGRHDNLYRPQYRRLEAAHWPFMRRATSVCAPSARPVAPPPASTLDATCSAHQEANRLGCRTKSLVL